MTESPYKKISLVSVGNIFNSLLGLTFLTAVARDLSVEQFGKYALFASILVLSAKFLDFGTNSIFVTKALSEENSKLKNTFITSKLLLFVIAIPLAILVLKRLDLFNSTTFVIYLVGLIGYLINISLFAFFQKLERFSLAVGLNTIPASIKVVFALLIIIGVIKISFVTAITIFSFSMISSALLAIYLPSEYKDFKISFKKGLKLLLESIPAGTSILITNGWPALANATAKLMKTFTDVGIFSIADKVASIFTLISISIFTVLLPRNTQIKKSKGQYKNKETFVLSAAIFLMAGVASVFAKILFPFVFGAKYNESIGLLGILIFASAFTAIHTFMESFFYIENKTKIMLGVTLTKLSLFVVAAMTLMPVYSLRGLAYAQLLASIVAVVATVGVLGLAQKN